MPISKEIYYTFTQMYICLLAYVHTFRLTVFRSTFLLDNISPAVTPVLRAA